MTYNDLVTNKLYSLNGGSTGGGAQRELNVTTKTHFRRIMIILPILLLGVNIVFWGTPSLFISLVLILKVTMLKKITEYIA